MALQTMYPSKPGSPLTSLVEPLAADGTSMTLDDATVLPSAPNIAVIGSDSSAEIVSYTAITGNVVSGLVRGLGGTTASAWTVNTAVARNITSYDHDTFKYNIEALNTEKISGVAWGDVTGTLSNQTDLQTALNAKQATYSADTTKWDTSPTASSTKPVTSDGIKTYVDNNYPYITVGGSGGMKATLESAFTQLNNLGLPKYRSIPVMIACSSSAFGAILTGTADKSDGGIRFLLANQNYIIRGVFVIATSTISELYTVPDILYYSSGGGNAMTVNAATNAQIGRIPASGTDSKITTNTVVLSIVFANPSAITSNVSWTSYAGYVTFSGTCTSATTANVILGQKGN